MMLWHDALALVARGRAMTMQGGFHLTEEDKDDLKIPGPGQTPPTRPAEDTESPVEKADPLDDSPPEAGPGN